MLELSYAVRHDVFGLVGEVEGCVMLIYEVNKEPEMRREMSQLQRCDGNGSDDCGTWKMCAAAPHEQDTVSSFVAIINLFW